MQSNVKIIEDQMTKMELSELRFQFSEDKGYPVVNFIVLGKDRKFLHSGGGEFCFNDALNEIAKFFIKQNKIGS